jgi:hypothetical protein
MMGIMAQAAVDGVLGPDQVAATMLAARHAWLPTRAQRETLTR